ncbi:MAG TPA: hypothetical protein VGB07_19385 [Blastocatellia bacterium]
MEERFDFIPDIYRDFVGRFRKEFLLHRRVRILIVVDTEISLTPGPNAFGIGRVIELLRSTAVGCTNFAVTLARRSGVSLAINANPAPDQPKYEGFRFDSKEAGKTIIEQFDEIWCFGFKPDNDNGPDSKIDHPDSLPTSDEELKALTKWMNERQGGMFATGDHDYLGAPMCRHIPRVGTMRRWTNADGVPPANGPGRIDTNRPATPGVLVIPDTQTDAVPQTIDWVAWMSVRVSLTQRRYRPHPVLCHPQHGPINVMPDHPHEGLCFDNHQVKLTGKDLFGADEYPTIGTVRPLPTVIAYGNTLSDPPYQHAKGDSQAKRFPMISVYDGHQVNIGRVAVDSTWHHWMDMNLTDIEAAPDTTNWEKISRYFLNLAIWLAPPGVVRHCITSEVLETHFTYWGVKEFSPKLPTVELGAALRDRLTLVYGPCWVTQFVLDWIRVRDLNVYRRLLDHYIPLRWPPLPPNPCLSCPPLDWLEAMVLGGIVRQTTELTQPIRRELGLQLKTQRSLKLEAAERQVLEGVGIGLKEAAAQLSESLRQTGIFFEGLK